MSVASEDRLSRRQLIGLDAAVAVAFTVWFLATGKEAGPNVPTWSIIVLVPVIGLPLAVRRLWPRTVLAIVFTAAVVEHIVDDGRLVGFFAAAFALYLVATTVRWPGWALGIGVLTAAGFLTGPQPGVGPATGRLVQGLTAMGAAWVIGRLVRQNRLGRAQLAQRAAEQAVLAERVRIARELHDVVAHSMSVIAVKAGVAGHVAKSHPEEVENALAVIESTSRDTLVEMRRMLGVLRADVEPDPSAGRPGLADLEGLATSAREASVRVDLRVEEFDVAEPQRTAVHRIVQEALTNVVKHAAPARCTVSVRPAGRDIQVEVTDDGRTLDLSEESRAMTRHSSDKSAGQGLIGMGERVVALGGAFEAGPRAEGGFRVYASLPAGDMRTAEGDPVRPPPAGIGDRR